MPSSDLRVLVNSLRALGYDVTALLAAVGLRDEEVNNPDARVPCDAYGAIVARALQTKLIPNLALAVARRVPIGTYPLLDYLVLTSDNIGAAVHQLVRYFQIVASPVVLTVQEDVDTVRVEIGGTPWPFAAEYSAALLVLHFRTETEGRFVADSVSFRHTPDDPADFQRVLGCPIRSADHWSGVTIARHVWSVPLRRRDPILRQVLEAQADAMLARLPSRTGLALEVQRVLSGRVTGHDTRIETLASRLAMSTRTLQRRLAAEGVSYQELLEDARKEAAGRYIAESEMSIGEVAYLVGYSEPAPFHRAFKRWFGTTPDAFRQKQRGA